jgi:anti-sigma regulatory factor (Ser/Thr protein kinase)
MAIEFAFSRQPPPAAEVAELHVPAELTSLAPVRRALGSALARRGWTGERAMSVLLAAHEAVANAVEHGSSDGAEVEVRFSVTPAQAAVWVIDGGRPGAGLPPDGTTPPSAGSSRGRGLIIMRALADRLETWPAGRGAAVLMEFRRVA